MDSVPGVMDIIKELRDVRDKLDSIIETLDVLSDKELVESIKRAEEDIESGRVYPFNL